MKIVVKGQGLEGLPTSTQISFKDPDSKFLDDGYYISNTDAVLSNVKRGKLIYTLPDPYRNCRRRKRNGRRKKRCRLFFRLRDFFDAFEPESGDEEEDTEIDFDVETTPIINRIYPSTVYSGQRICFNVFTDKTNEEGQIIQSATIEQSNIDINIPSSISQTADYQICGTVGEDIMGSSDAELTVEGPTGDYVISEFAYSYDKDVKYLARTLPTVTLMQTSTLYKAGGSHFTIRGIGFSKEKENNLVTVDDLSCEVLYSTTNEIICQLPEKTTDTTMTSYYVGGLGARVKAYKTTKGNLNESETPFLETVYTDLDIERNAITSTPETRVIETWFVPPQDGNYTILALCDDHCEVQLSTVDMDPSAATSILSTNTWSYWRQYPSPRASVYESDPQDLLADNHYYMKIIHSETSGNDHMTVGMRIEDDSTSRGNSESEWKSLKIEPNQNFEMFEIFVDNPAYTNSTVYQEYVLQYISSGVAYIPPSFIFLCPEYEEACGAVSGIITANTTASQFKNAVKAYFNSFEDVSNYGNYMTVTKIPVDESLVELSSSTPSEDVYQYKFTMTSRLTVSSPNVTSIELIEYATTIQYFPPPTVVSFPLLQNSSNPLTGKYIIQVTYDGETDDTEDLDLNTAANIIEREIYRVEPELMGALEIQRITSTYVTGREGLEIIYRLASGFEANFTLASSTEEPLLVEPEGNETVHPIDFFNEVYIEGSNKPFYEVIPAAYLRTVETAPQVVVTSDGLRALCVQTPFCDIAFIDDVALITTRTETPDFDELIMNFTGTSIPTDELMKVSVGGLLRTCIINYGSPVNSTQLSCVLENPITGTHEVLVQTRLGALPNDASIVDLDIDIQVDSVSPTTVTENGGTYVTLTGDFFPLSLEEAQSLGANFTVTLGGVECTFVSVSRTTFVVSSPAGLVPSTLVDLVVTLNGKVYTHATQFSVSSAPGVVSGVLPLYVCPPIKRDLVISVDTLPSSNVSDYSALLSTADREINMKVNEIDVVNNTLTVRYPGVSDNIEFTVFVLYNNERYNSSITLFAVSTIEGFSIDTNNAGKTEISTTGGDTVTITGQGFTNNSTDTDSVVVQFGDSTATVVSVTQTEIVVEAARAQVAGITEIKVFVAFSVEARCDITDGCNITYSSDQAPTVDNIAEPFNADIDNIITITGTGFGTSLVAYLDNYAQTIISNNETEIVVKLTSIAFRDTLFLDIQTVDDIGLPLITVALTVPEALLSISPSIGSSAGQVLTLSTIGIELNDTSNFDLYYTSNGSDVSVCQEITMTDSETIECLTIYDTEVPDSSELSLTYEKIDSETEDVTTVTLSCETATSCYYHTLVDQTPVLNVTVSGSTYTGVLTGYTFNATETYTVTIYYDTLTEVGTLDTITGTVTATFANGIPPGSASTRIMLVTSSGVSFYSTSFNVTVNATATATSVTTCSWAGGCQFTIAQDGILDGVNLGGMSVEVCDDSAELDIDASTAGSLVVTVPAHITRHSLSSYSLVEAGIITGTYSSNPVDEDLFAFDGFTSTEFESIGTNGCYLQVDLGTKVGVVEKVRYFMDRMTDKQDNFVGNIVFQQYNDATMNYTDVFTVDSSLREGWNEYDFTTALESTSYRFSFTSANACQMSEVELIGYVIEENGDMTKTCGITLYGLGGDSFVISGANVTYEDTATAIVTDISPDMGSVRGGETITITGSNFSTVTSEISVLIDEIECVITSATSTEIVCVTGARPSVPEQHSTVIYFSGTTQNGYAVMQGNEYIYANFWSDIDTWVGEFPPVDGDSIVVPAGQTLIVDIDVSPKLQAVIVQGQMKFLPDSDMTHLRTFDAEYIYVDVDGKLEIGTETARYTSKLCITMHGTRESPQIPIYGNKGIFVRGGTLDIHGKERDFSWAELGETVEANNDTITLLTEVDWQVNECIVIAPSDFNYDHAEEFCIKEVNTVTNTDGDTVTQLTLYGFTQYRHVSGTFDYTASNLQYAHTLNSSTDTYITDSSTPGSKTKTITMRAEVGLLTRNVVFKGADADSINDRYGAHIMLHAVDNESVIGRISYIEIYQAGQAFQLGRYPIHYYMLGIAHDSYIKGNSIHHTYNRACTVHGVHYLSVEYNVAYETMGHTFFIEDGAETKNYINSNLAMKTQRSHSLLNTDQIPASFWITHPDNQFVNNHAAGSVSYGFWFNLPVNPTGPSQDTSICPQFDQLGEFNGNVAHSNGGDGLRIFNRFTPTDNPCGALGTNAHSYKGQPSSNIASPVDTYFRNFTAYKNRNRGVFAYELGALKFVDIKAADNLAAGVEFSITSVGPWLSETDDYHLMDSLIVGYSSFAESPQFTRTTTRGIIGASTEKMRVRDVLFASFNTNLDSAAISTCSQCSGTATDSSGRTYFYRDLYFYDTPNKVKFNAPHRDIIYDEDGTLGNETHRWVVYYWKHIDVDACVRDEDTYNGLLCSRDVSVRRVVFYGSNPYHSFKYQPIKILNINQIADLEYGNNTDDHLSCPFNRSSLSTLYSNDDSSWTNQLGLFGEYESHGEAYKTFRDIADARSACTTLCGNDTSGNRLGGCYVEDDTKNSSYYCSSANEPTIAAFNPVDTCESSCTLSCFDYLCEEARHNESLAEINVFIDQRDADYGLYDKLWETDGYYCNAENYADIDFRYASNPARNWVFPIVTGQEYNVHWGQGIDITKMYVQYSSAYLLKGETRGAIMHLNHTERTEEWYLKFSNSSGSQTHIGVGIRDSLDNNVTIPAVKDKLSINTTSQMGDIYANNVTRHVAVKFDGQRNDSLYFYLERDECVTEGGCNNKNQADPNAIEDTPRFWSDPTSWPLGVLPVEGEDVIIEGTWNMVFDIEISPIFRSIEINGRLTIQSDREDHTVRAEHIWVRAGELIVGSEDCEFLGTATFELHGDRSSLDVQFNPQMFEGGNKVIANTGKIAMYGFYADPMIRLGETAPANQSWILLANTPTLDCWAVGDKLALAPSGRNYEESDYATIAFIDGRNITLESPLTYTHYGASGIDANESSTIDIRTEVIHLTRNIRIVGTNEDRWGAHLVTAHNNDVGFVGGILVPEFRKGHTVLHNVEFSNCSQYDTDKAAVRFAGLKDLDDEDPRSEIKNSIVHNGEGIGMLVVDSEDVILENNVIFAQNIAGISIKDSENITVTNNVVAGLGTRYWSTDTTYDELAGILLCSDGSSCTDITFHNNTVAGAPKLGFILPTTTCTDTSTYSNNVAHAVDVGVYLYTNPAVSGCHAFSSFKAYKTVSQGVLGYQGFSGNLKVSNIEVMDNGVGIALGVGEELDNTSIELKDSVIIGESASLVDVGSDCIDIYGFWTSTSTQGGTSYPPANEYSLPLAALKSYGNWIVSATGYNVTFKNWSSGQRSCDSLKEQKALLTNPTARDLVPMQIFNLTTFDNVAHAALAKLTDPDPSWMGVGACGLQFSCTGPHNFGFKFYNSTAIGANTPTINNINDNVDSFQIIPNNPQATNWILGCSLVSDWNANLCYNERIGQVLFESLDDDKETRIISPINILRYAPNEFNNTLNSFSNGCYGSGCSNLNRLSRFPGLLETNQKHEIYYTGTPPKSSRYTLTGGDLGVDYVHLVIDFSESRLYDVYDISDPSTETQISANTFSRTDKRQKDLEYTSCGEYRYEAVTYIYEFYVPIGCTVKLQAKDSIQGNIRLQMTYDEFFDKGGSIWFVFKLANSLGIDQSRIRFVGVYEGSVIVDWYVESDTALNNPVEELEELNDFLASQHASGNLTFDDIQVLDVSGQVVTSDGTITSSTSGFSKKEVSKSVYVMMILGAILVFGGFLFAIYECIKASRSSKSTVDVDRKQYNKAVTTHVETFTEKPGRKQISGIFEESKVPEVVN